MEHAIPAAVARLLETNMSIVLQQVLPTAPAPNEQRQAGRLGHKVDAVRVDLSVYPTERQRRTRIDSQTADRRGRVKMPGRIPACRASTRQGLQ